MIDPSLRRTEDAMGTVLTVVSAVLEDERADGVVSEFEKLLATPWPDGLERTELLSGPDGLWQIQSLWRDRAALDAMRASGEPPAAPALLSALGGTPSLQVLERRAGR
jgi:hypothetical protein